MKRIICELSEFAAVLQEDSMFTNVVCCEILIWREWASTMSGLCTAVVPMITCWWGDSHAHVTISPTISSTMDFDDCNDGTYGYYYTSMARWWALKVKVLTPKVCYVIWRRPTCANERKNSCLLVMLSAGRLASGSSCSCNHDMYAW